MKYNAIKIKDIPNLNRFERITTAIKDEYRKEITSFKSERLKITNWLLLNETALDVYFEVLWDYRDRFKDIVKHYDNLESLFGVSFCRELKETIEIIEDDMSSIDFYFDDKPSFLYQNFWILISDMIKDGVSTEFADLVLEEIPLSEANEKSEKLMIEAIKSMKYEVSLAKGEIEPKW